MLERNFHYNIESKRQTTMQIYNNEIVNFMVCTKNLDTSREHLTNFLIFSLRNGISLEY